jgi:hypothetical protein
MLLKFLHKSRGTSGASLVPGHRFSIYQRVVERLKFANTSLSRSDTPLPDEDVVAGRAGFRWVAGAFDGAVSLGAEGDDAEAITAQIFLALRSLADRATDEHAARLYSLVAQHRTLLFVDALLERVVNEKTLQTDRIQAMLARWQQNRRIAKPLRTGRTRTSGSRHTVRLEAEGYGSGGHRGEDWCTSQGTSHG